MTNPARSAAARKGWETRRRLNAAIPRLRAQEEAHRVWERSQPTVQHPSYVRGYEDAQAGRNPDPRAYNNNPIYTGGYDTGLLDAPVEADSREAAV